MATGSEVVKRQWRKRFAEMREGGDMAQTRNEDRNPQPADAEMHARKQAASDEIPTDSLTKEIAIQRHVRRAKASDGSWTLEQQKKAAKGKPVTDDNNSIIRTAATIHLKESTARRNHRGKDFKLPPLMADTVKKAFAQTDVSLYYMDKDFQRACHYFIEELRHREQDPDYTSKPEDAKAMRALLAGAIHRQYENAQVRLPHPTAEASYDTVGVPPTLREVKAMTDRFCNQTLPFTFKQLRKLTAEKARIHPPAVQNSLF
jgi:hypothetical protein